MNLKLYKSPNCEDNPNRANLPGPLENYRNVTRMNWGKGWETDQRNRLEGSGMSTRNGESKQTNKTPHS